MNEQNKNNKDDQVTDLRKLIDEVQQSESIQEKHESLLAEESNQIRKIDILNLPPRKEIHSKQQKKLIRIKLSKPLLRLLMVMIILLAVIIGAYFI